ncbi:MAG: hypothetical protein ACLFTJ_02490 [Halothece sp.]
MTELTSIFGTIPEDSIFNPVPPYNLRNDCQVGQWKRGESDYKGSSLEIAVIKARKFYGVLGESRAHWLQLWFIASPNEDKLPKNTVCCTYLKTRSLDNLSGKLIELMTSNTDPGRGIFTAKFEKTQGKMGTYYYLDWDYRERDGEDEEFQLEMIAEFMQQQPTFIDTNKPNTLVCTDGMTPEQIDDLDEVINAIQNGEQPTSQQKQLNGAVA